MVFYVPVRGSLLLGFVETTGRDGVSLPTGMGRRVAYASQFLDADHRAHRGKAKIKARLIGDCDPDEWELPPKPKWMRWSTYNRLVERFDAYRGDLGSRSCPS